MTFFLMNVSSMPMRTRVYTAGLQQHGLETVSTSDWAAADQDATGPVALFNDRLGEGGGCHGRSVEAGPSWIWHRAQHNRGCFPYPSRYR